MSVIGSNWDAQSSRDGEVLGNSALPLSSCDPPWRKGGGRPPGAAPTAVAASEGATYQGCSSPRVFSCEDSCQTCRGAGTCVPPEAKFDPSPSEGHVVRCRHWCLARGHRVLQRLSATCGANNYALLGPVTCGELHLLSELLWHDLCQVQWLYIALQDPYRQGDFRQRATQALVCLAGALAHDATLKGLVLRMPQLKLDPQQLERVIAAFGDALRINTTLISLQLKPSGFFERMDPSGFQDLVQAGRLSDAQRMAFLLGTAKRRGRQCSLQNLPQEVLQRILDNCDCTVRND